LTAPVRAPTRFAQVAQARATAGKPKGAVPFFSWAQRIPEPKLGRLSFEDYPFQVELYSDGADHPDTCVKKATQVGISAYLLRWVLYWPDQRGLTGLYVFPRRKQMYDFADARVDAAIRRSEYLAARVGNPGADMKGVDNKGLKRVGTGWVYFRGSESEDDLDSVDADVLCMDEYDRLKAANIPVAERRVSGEHSLGLIRRVGVPSVPNGAARPSSRRRAWPRAGGRPRSPGPPGAATT
jgi:phage terminase large subunit GpA-like protein